MTWLQLLRLATVALCLIALGTFHTTALAQADCGFSDGFLALRDQIGAEVVGECLAPPQAVQGGNVEQRTTGGLLVWEKLTNLTAFTDGNHTWINGPNGVERRHNSEQFPWEQQLRDQAEVTPRELAVLYVEAVRGRVDVELEYIYARGYEMAMDRLSRWMTDRKAQLSSTFSGGVLPAVLGWFRLG